MEIFVKPVGRCRVRDPETGQLLPKEGRRVRAGQFWYRRLEAGEVEQVKEPPASRRRKE